MADLEGSTTADTAGTAEGALEEVLHIARIAVGVAFVTAEAEAMHTLAVVSNRLAATVGLVIAIMDIHRPPVEAARIYKMSSSFVVAAATAAFIAVEEGVEVGCCIAALAAAKAVAEV